MRKATLLDGSLHPRVHRRRYRPNGLDRAQVTFQMLQRHGVIVHGHDQYRSPLKATAENGEVLVNRLRDNWDATDDFTKVNLPPQIQPLEENQDD